jgi:hypothetical protein
LVERVEGLGEDASVGEDGHEIVVAFPAGDDVEMEVFDDAGTGAFAEVEADVEALGFDRGAEKLLGVFGEVPKFEFFAFDEHGEVGDFPVRDDHHVADGVRVAVHDEEGVFATGDDEVGGVIGGLGGVEEEIGSGAGFEVLDAPWGPEGGKFGWVHSKGRLNAETRRRREEK